MPSLLKASYRLIRFLSDHKGGKGGLSPVLIMTHDYPDPDALASAFGLHYLLQKGFGIRSRMVYGGVVGRMENRVMVRLLKIPVRKINPGDLKNYAHVALVDTQPQFQNNAFPKNRKAALVIDQHHPFKKPSADFSIIDIECGATSVILAEALLLMRLSIPERVATALAYGIMTDTQNLFRATRRDVIQVYLGILPHANLKVLARIQNPQKSERFFLTLRRGIERAGFNHGLIVSHLGKVENPDFVAQTADMLLTYQKANWSFCTGRYKGRLHASLRLTRPIVQADSVLRAVFADRGEAGGHGTIAGGSCEVGLAAKEKIWQKLERDLAHRLFRKFRKKGKGSFKHVFHF